MSQHRSGREIKRAKYREGLFRNFYRDVLSLDLSYKNLVIPDSLKGRFESALVIASELTATNIINNCSHRTRIVVDIEGECDLDKYFCINERETSELYMIRTPYICETLSNSFQVLDGQGNGRITLVEYLIATLFRSYTKDYYLDQGSYSRCPGSRSEEGFEPVVYFEPEDNSVHIDCFDPLDPFDSVLDIGFRPTQS